MHDGLLEKQAQAKIQEELRRSIADREKAEEELRRLNTTLEQRVAERTILAENRSNQLQKLAVQLIEAEEKERQRIAQLLHDDLQQLLAAARMQLEAASESLPANQFLDNVLHLIGESIAKSRRLSHELSPPVLHHGNLASALEWLKHEMEEQFGLNVDLVVQGEPPAADETQKVFLFRAAQELLFNVIKHAGVDRAKVALISYGHWLTLSISDSGRGLAIDRLNSPAARSGLGLVSLQERARSIKGEFSIESTPGQGCCFTLTLPIENASARKKTESTAQPPGIDEQIQDSDARIRVLFADDHKVMRQGLIKLISGQPNIQLAGEAASGRDALRLAYQLKPDVILMDISMPDLDGIQATRWIKAKYPNIRVIGLSMHDDEQVAQAMFSAGADAFLCKSVSSAQLLKVIYAVADRRHPRAAPDVCDSSILS